MVFQGEGGGEFTQFWVLFFLNMVFLVVSKLRVNKGTNRSLGDTNMRFGTNDPHILLI